MKSLKHHDEFLPKTRDLLTAGFGLAALLFFAGICIGLGQYTVAWVVSHVPALALSAPVDPE